MYLSAIDRKILNLIQRDIPLSTEPFKVLSSQLGIAEDKFLQKIRQFKKRGIIRNFSASLNHRKLDFKSSLIALRVPLNRIESIAKSIIEYPEVTHCYLRKGEHNLWLVFLCMKDKELNFFLVKLAKQIGKENILNLPTIRQFKLNGKLRL